MIVERPSFPSPVLVIDDFLPQQEAEACFRECMDLRRLFRQSRVGAGRDNRVDPGIRNNLVAYLDQLYGEARQQSDILSCLDRRISSEECKALWHKGDLIFDAINYSNRRETTLSRYGRTDGKGDFYGRHQDTIFDTQNPDSIRARLVTLCYYMNREPKAYSGGDIALFKCEETLTVTPKHNRAIVFPSFTHHEVRPTVTENDEFESGRFSVNCWMGFR